MIYCQPCNSDIERLVGSTLLHAGYFIFVIPIFRRPGVFEKTDQLRSSVAGQRLFDSILKGKMILDFHDFSQSVEIETYVGLPQFV